MIPSCWVMCNICILVYSRARLYNTSQTLPVIALPPSSTNQTAGSSTAAHEHEPTFIQTEYRTMIFIIWLIIQLLQLQTSANVLTVLVAWHVTTFYICNAQTIEDASENATETNPRVFKEWIYVWSRMPLNVISYVQLGNNFSSLCTSASVWDA
jgi:hypothetical protein